MLSSRLENGPCGAEEERMREHHKKALRGVLFLVLAAVATLLVVACEGAVRLIEPDCDCPDITDGDADGDSDSDVDSDGDGDADSDVDADGDSDGDGDVDADSDVDSDGDADGDSDGDADADIYGGDADGDSDGDGDADGDLDDDVDADGDVPVCVSSTESQCEAWDRLAGFPWDDDGDHDEPGWRGFAFRTECNCPLEYQVGVGLLFEGDCWDFETDIETCEDWEADLLSGIEGYASEFRFEGREYLGCYPICWTPHTTPAE